MKQQIERKDTYSFATVVDEKCDIVSVIISVDIYQKQTLLTQVAQYLYGEALLSGNKDFSREEFLNAINILGASIDVKVQDSIVSISLKSRAEHFKKVLKLMESMMKAPRFDKKELTRIKLVSINELHEAKEDSKTVAFNSLRNSFYEKGDRRYSYNIEDSISEIKKITVKELRCLHEDLMTGFWVCSAVGSESNVKSMQNFVKKTLENINEKTELDGHYDQLDSKPKVVLIDIPSRANVDFSIGSPITMDVRHKDYIPLSFGIAVLAKWGGFSGRLMSTVREKEGLTYGIYGQLEGFWKQEKGYWRIMTFFAPDKACQGLSATFREVKDIFKNGITEDELKKFKVIIGTQQKLLKDSIEGQLAELHKYHCQGFSVDEIESSKERISLLTRGEVNAVIKKYLNPINLHVSGAGPIKGVEKKIKELIKSVQ